MNATERFTNFQSSAGAPAGAAPAGRGRHTRTRTILPPLWFFALLFASFFTSCSGSSPVDTTPVIDVGDNNTNIVLASGDSVTYDVESSSHSGYRGTLQLLLSQQGKDVVVVNGGRSGARTSNYSAVASDISLYNPAVIILQFGINDALNLSDSDIPGVTQNMRNLVNAALGNDSVTILTTLNPVCGSRYNQNRLILLINESYRQLALEYSDDEGFVLADVGAAFAENDATTAGCAFISHVNDNHPNSAGYALMAQVIALGLEPISWE